MAAHGIGGEEDMASGADDAESLYEDGKKDNEACEQEDSGIWRPFDGRSIHSSVQRMRIVEVKDRDILVNYDKGKLLSMRVEVLRGNTLRVKGTPADIARVVSYLATGIEDPKEDAQFERGSPEAPEEKIRAKADGEDEETRDDGAEAPAAPDGDLDHQSLFIPVNVYEMGKKTLTIMQCDITKAPVDAIVNPMGKSFEKQGGQVAQSIKTEAGGSYEDTMKDYAAKNKVLKKGECVATPLPKVGRRQSFKYVLHTRGPEKSVLKLPPLMEKNLRKAVRGVLKEVDSLSDVASVAIPAIGTGNAGMKAKTAIRTLLLAIIDYEVQNEVEIYLVSPEQEIVQKFVEEMDKILKGKRDSEAIPGGDG